MTQNIPENASRREAPGAERRKKESRRLGWEAFFAVLAVHALLLGLFRFAPRENPPEANELPAVGSIDLNARGNAALVQWLTIHDPALLTAPNREHGYSAAAGQVRFHHPIGDLPHPPLLNAPESAAARTDWVPAEPPAGRIFRTELIAAPAAEPGGKGGGAVFLNGRAWEAPVRALLGCLDDRRSAGAAIPGKASVFVLAPPRGAGLAPRFVLTESCGEAAYDQAAGRLLRRHLAAAAQTGLVAVDWRRLAKLRKGDAP